MKSPKCLSMIKSIYLFSEGSINQSPADNIYATYKISLGSQSKERPFSSLTIEVNMSQAPPPPPPYYDDKSATPLQGYTALPQTNVMFVAAPSFGEDPVNTICRNCQANVSIQYPNYSYQQVTYNS